MPRYDQVATILCKNIYTFHQKGLFWYRKVVLSGIARKMFCKCYSRITIFRHCLTTHFNIKVWKHSRETYFCRYRFKTSFEAFFPAKPDLLEGKFAFVSPSFLSRASHPSGTRNVFSWIQLPLATCHMSSSDFHWKLLGCRNSTNVKDPLNIHHMISYTYK